MTGAFGQFIRQRVQQELAQAAGVEAPAAEQGLALATAGDPAGARPWLLAALAEPTCTTEVVTTLATILEAAGEPEAAIAALRKGLDRIPTSEQPTLWLQLGEYLQAQGQPDEAEQALRLVLKRHKAHPDALLKLGVLCFEAGRAEEAEDWLRQAITGDRKAVMARQYLALVYMDREDWRGATAQLHWIKQADPASNEAPLLQATMFERQGDPRSAIAELEALAERGKAGAAVYWRIARLHMGLKQRPEALAAFQACAARDRTRVEALIYAGRILESLERPDEALAAYQQVLAFQPDHADAAMFAARLWEARQAWEKAIGLYELAQASTAWQAQATAARDRLTELLAAMAAMMSGTSAAPADLPAAPPPTP